MPLPRAAPDIVSRRNNNYLLLLLILPCLAVMMYWFWEGFVAQTLRAADVARIHLLAENRQRITEALSSCRRDTGGAPVRLEVLQQFGCASGDLSPGGNPRKWRGPYLPSSDPFPTNPYLPLAGIEGWRYVTHGDEYTLTPAHDSAR